jgi:hypothetical protein
MLDEQVRHTTDFEFQQFIDSNSCDISLSPDPLGTSVTYLPTPDPHEECFRKLADLHSNLLSDLNLVNGNKTIYGCSITNNISDTAAPGACSFTIGRMLINSAKCLEVLQYFAPVLSKCTSSIQNVTTQPPNNISEPQRQELIHADVPTNFSILTSYVCLLRIYRTIFSCVYVSYFDGKLSHTQPQPLFPELQLGGFSLDGRPNLQVQVLVHISENLVGRIDSALGLPDKIGK